jgi:5-methylcytosine-specific restriction endonuclease McrA
MSEFVPLRPCGVCQQLFPGGDCPRHPRKGGYRPHRPSVVGNVYGRAYRRVRDLALAAAGYRCAYCSGPARTGDHVKPLSKGGRTASTNVVAACSRCNTSKGDRTLTEWVHTGLAPEPAIRLLARRISQQLPV